MKKSSLILLAVPFLLIGCSGGATSSSDNPSTSPSVAPSVAPSSSELPSEPPVYDEPAIAIHYNYIGENYSKRALWLWPTGGDGKEYLYNGQDDFGAVASLPLSTWSEDVVSIGLNLIDKQKGSWTDQGPDVRIDFSKASQDENSCYHVWLKHFENDKVYYERPSAGYDILTCEFTDFTHIKATTGENVKGYKVFEDGTLIKEGAAAVTTISVTLDKAIDLTKSYTLEVHFSRDDKLITTDVNMTALYGTDEFNNKFYYDGELGAIYTPSKTTFRVWSPLSKKLILRVYDNGTPKSTSSTLGDDTHVDYEMSKGVKGTWEKEISGDLEGKYYTYLVTNSKFDNFEIVDPYAKSAGVNGLRGMIVDFSKTNPTGWNDVNYLNYDRKELTVWETHVADVTSASSWNGTPENSKKFKGMYEAGTTFTKDSVTVKTGFDHIKELGVNAVQLLPIFDQANDEVNVSFNWGYNPLNYNVVEGCYSSNPYDGYTRIKELKELVMAYNKAGIEIIMDVVYNHVNGLSNSNFDVLLPGYYFRYVNGNPSNGSGCGNETASEMKMFRKFMIDSTAFWMKEYKLGGFRFDLMGLHDLDTMEQLSANLKTINTHAVVYGEPWQGGTSPLPSGKCAKQDNLKQFVGYGCFNDKLRDGLVKGGLNSASSKGWAMGTSDVGMVSDIYNGMCGRTSSILGEADKTVNYVTCHDNYCLYDRYKAAGITDEEVIRKNAVLANAVVFTSQGTTFMLGGDEILRTKGGNSNSYNASYKVNEIDYALKVKNLDIFETYKKLINFKQTCDAMHLIKDQIASSVTTGKTSDTTCLTVKINYGGKNYMIVHANGQASGVKLDLSGYSVILDTLGLYSTVGNNQVIKPYQSLILSK